jgi:hypothetical protein
MHRAERTIAERLMRLADGTLPWPWIDPDKALPWVEKHIGLALAESQVAAIRLSLMSKLLVMTGGPGVGKARPATERDDRERKKEGQETGVRPNGSGNTVDDCTMDQAGHHLLGLVQSSDISIGL